jgi:hypothetical protein
MQRFQILIAGLLLFCTGCGREELPFTDNSQDPVLYTKSMRTMIETNCKLARTGDPAVHLSPLYMELNRDDRPLGSHGEVFAEMRDVCNDAVKLVKETPGGRPDINSHLDQMVKLAEQLPLNTDLAKPPARDTGAAGGQ